MCIRDRLGGGAALLTFASCSTFDTDNAATVNGTDITSDQLDAVRDHIADNADQFASAEDLDDAGEAKGDLTRAVLSVLIRNDVARHVLAAAGGTLTDEQLAEAKAGLGGDDLPEGPAADALIQRNALGAALDTLPAPDADQLRSLYDDQPASTGVVCLQIVSAPTKDAIEAAAGSLRAGESPATGGDLQSQAACIPVEQLGGGLAVDDLDLLLNGQPGDVSGLIGPDASAESPTWTVIRLQPWADAEQSLTALFAGTAAADGSTPPTPGQLALAGALVTADVTVSSSYGKWDPLAGGVVALTSAPEGDTTGAA